MDDPAAILRAQLDEEERTARDAEMSPERLVGIPRAYAAAPIAIHIARHDPARVLREVEAMRKVLDCWPDPTGAWTADQADAARAMKARILELLAEPYAPQSPPEQPKED